VPECINSGRYTKMTEGLAGAVEINATPTVRINGEDFEYSTPDALVAKITEIVGELPGASAQPVAPAPTAPGQAPAAP
jgi:hypothetical protein